MELRPRTKVSGFKPRAASEGRTQLGTKHLFNPVDTRVNSPSSATGIARGGKTPSRTLSSSSPNPRSESAGGAGNPPRRRGQNWESGDAGGGSVFNLDPEVVADASGKPFRLPDGQTAEFTHAKIQ